MCTPVSNELLGQGYRFMWEVDQTWVNDTDIPDYEIARVESVTLRDPDDQVADHLGGVLFSSQSAEHVRRVKRETEESVASAFVK